MSEKIAGQRVPKWIMPDGIYTVHGEDFDVRETLGKNSQFLVEQAKRDEAKKTRAMAGLCENCRSTKCLCNEGQS